MNSLINLNQGWYKMNQYTIEIDEIIMNYLKKNADPFVDTPNTVLHKLLFGTRKVNEESKPMPPILAHSLDRKSPKALEQILEVIEEVIKNGHHRPKATRIVADRNGTAPQTIIDKYCRQLGKTASEVDMLLGEPGLGEFKSILTNKFPHHRDMIASFFYGLYQGVSKVEQISQYQGHFSKPISKKTNIYESVSERKKRDTARESALKYALGYNLKNKFGPFTIEGQSQLVFNGTQVLCKFSSFHDDQSRWFWGVSSVYWQNWESTDYLALIMENEGHDGYSYIILDSEEAQFLFNACSESGGEKKINMHVYADDNLARFQEWKDFDVATRSQPIDIDTNDSSKDSHSIYDFDEPETTVHEGLFETPTVEGIKMYSFQELELMDIDKRTRPQGVRLGDTLLPVSDWSDLWVHLLNHLLKTGQLQKKHLPIFSYSSRREKYLINTEPKHFYPEKDGNWKRVGDFYVDVKYNADAHFKNLIHLFKQIEISTNDFAISFK